MVPVATVPARSGCVSHLPRGGDAAGVQALATFGEAVVRLA